MGGTPPERNIAMNGPLYDHQLDATPPSVGPSALKESVARVGRKVRAGDGRKKADLEAISGLAVGLMTFYLCTCLLLLIPIAVFAPRALASRFLERKAATVLFIHGSLFLLFVLTVGAWEFLRGVAAWPYLGVACLAGGVSLGVDYLRGTRGRLRRARDDAKAKGASRFVELLAATGFIGGAIPRPLRVIVVYGLIGGTAGAVSSCMGLASLLGAPPAGEDGRVVLLGRGVVRGSIGRVDVVGPYEYGTGRGYSSGSTTILAPARLDSIEIGRRGMVAGAGLTVEMEGRGVAFLGRDVARGWAFVDLAEFLASALLVVACASAAKGRRIGFALALAWAIAALGYGLGHALWLPEGREVFDCVSYLFPAAVLAVLGQTSVRAYLGRAAGPDRRDLPREVPGLVAAVT